MRVPDEMVAELGPPLSGPALAAAEARLGALPDELRAFLAEQNGAVLERAGFGERYEVRALYGVGFAPYYDLLDPLGEVPDGLVGIGEDSFGNTFCLARESGEVCFLDHELEGEEAVTPIAPSLAAFVAGLEQRPPIDLRGGPTDAYVVGGGALSGAISAIDQDIETFRAGKRSASNTKAWCRARAGGAVKHLRRWKTGDLRRALDAVDAADDADALVAAMEAVKPELEALMPAWIRKRRPGYALDENYLRERGR